MIKRILSDLVELGVGYRKNYGGEFETCFPHSYFSFHIEIAEKGVFVSMEDAEGESHPIASCGSDDKLSVGDELETALKNTLETVKTIDEICAGIRNNVKEQIKSRGKLCQK